MLSTRCSLDGATADVTIAGSVRGHAAVGDGEASHAGDGRVPNAWGPGEIGETLEAAKTIHRGTGVLTQSLPENPQKAEVDCQKSLVGGLVTNYSSTRPGNYNVANGCKYLGDNHL
jgi:hypothetical protein